MPSQRKREVIPPTRVTLPVSVACDLEKLQRALANIAHMVGASSVGVAIRRSREFVVDPASLQVKVAASEG